MSGGAYFNLPSLLWLLDKHGTWLAKLPGREFWGPGPKVRVFETDGCWHIWMDKHCGQPARILTWRPTVEEAKLRAAWANKADLNHEDDSYPFRLNRLKSSCRLSRERIPPETTAPPVT
jgi:hypothetical protein